ncbi:LysR family transcriptional regulator substrate-binding protein [Lactobacillus ultunensis]|nr:LysR family transcriptional regulator substrate-binding protein [Lactobacillus ultunensis]KRL82621.1 hypothetical protein FC57_GL001395 [Lactobacillus ultunensis DSM 16047]QQP29373.1 LysR family transcriptional regulator substrate-binding protein [Lactobacillus ultunensis]
MNQLRIAYFDQLGRRELDAAKDKLKQVYPSVNIKLVGTGHDEIWDKLTNHEVDLAINDLRDEKNSFSSETISKSGLMAILQKGSYLRGVQMIEKSELTDLTCFIVAKPEEEAAELHLFKDLYQIKSPFIASNSVEEAALLVASGSGYFLMNENTAKLIKNDSLQQLFLLDEGKQMHQTIAAFYQEKTPIISKFLQILKTEY